jgi:TolB-like protein/tetratricopeptide (TPR) repeat protein
MTSFWGELKRRNVVRVAIAYVIVSWLILQLSDVLISMLGLAESVGKLIFLILVVSLPLALLFAWAFELTPEGIKKEKHVDRSESVTHVTGRKLDFAIIGVLAVALVFFAIDKYVLDAETTPATNVAREIVATVAKQSIAVLPFVNMSSDPEQEYFSDGLSEEILNLLAKIPELKVIGRTSSFAFKGKNEDLRGIGQALGVSTVLEGSVRKSGERVRITAQLIDVTDGAHLWSDTYDRTITDIFAVQDDVAAAIIDALQIHVGIAPTRGRPTENSAAYALFLKGRAAFNATEWFDADAFLRQAVELDPGFAEAFEYLAYIQWYQGGWLISSLEGQRRTYEAAAQALAIDPNLVLARAMYDVANIETYTYRGAIEALEHAVREQPGNPALLDSLIWYMMEAGYFRDSLRLAERFVELEPLMPQAHRALSDALYVLGRYGEAAAVLELADQLSSSDSNWAKGAASLLNKQYDIAIAYFEASLEQGGLRSDWVRELVTGARDPATGQAYLDRRIPDIVASVPIESAYNARQTLKLWYVFFGYLDRYYELILEHDINDGEWSDAEVLLQSGVLFWRLGFTAHPKYLAVAEALGIVDLWEHHGPPDFCEKVGGEWVCE